MNDKKSSAPDLSESTRRADWPVIAGAILALVVALAVAYVGGYFATSDLGEFTARPFMLGGTLVAEAYTVRTFKSGWLRTAYWPAAKVEALMVGYEIENYGDFGYEFTP